MNSQDDPPMEGLKHLAKIREYADYVERHLRNVHESWETINRACASMHPFTDDFLRSQMQSMIEEHDVSKMDAHEFIQYQRHWYPLDPSKRGGSGTKEDFELAWKNHQHRNHHHWQNWTDIANERFPNERACHCVCMVVDWMAMGLEFNDTAEEYYLKNIDSIDLPEWGHGLCREIFARLK